MHNGTFDVNATVAVLGDLVGNKHWGYASHSAHKLTLNDISGSLSPDQMESATDILQLYMPPLQQLYMANSSQFVRVDRLTCLKLYSTPLGNRSDVLLVSTEANSPNNSLLGGGAIGALDRWGDWMYGTTNDFSYVQVTDGTATDTDVASFNVIGYPIDHCMSLSISTDEACSIFFSLPIMIGEWASVLLMSACLTLLSCMRSELLQGLGHFLHILLLSQVRVATAIGPRRHDRVFP